MSKGIIGNKQTGLVGDVLKNSISKGSKNKEIGQRWMDTNLILQDIV
ncbi:hypothetical protein HOO54_06800 [Bacillus sp. WMMC1349]|nr:hypothetical protein [Bacillus sp. WMMC1349]NPC91927.1 hypothetical protein [Bacillus sp. WMMC1349]